MMEPTVDVAILGAGVSGLTAARRLVGAGVDSVAVIEAKPRVGGRTRNDPILGGADVVDAGAMMVLQGQSEVMSLAEELGLALYPMGRAGRSVFVDAGERITHEGPTPPRPPEAFEQFGAALRRFGELTKKVPTAAPWDAPDAEMLDAMSLAAWRDEVATSPEARRMLDSYFAAWTGTRPEHASLLYALRCGRTSGGAKGMLGRPYLFRDGTQSMSLRMAEELGERVHLGAPVHRLDQTGGERVEVLAHGLELSARRVIVTVNPQGARGIQFAPDLPRTRAGLHDGWQSGFLIKANVVYRDRFWGDDGLSGSASSDLGIAPAVLDVSPASGNAGVLTVVTYVLPEDATSGNPGRILGDARLRRDTMLAALSEFFGPKALEPLEYHEGNWVQEPYTHGCMGTTAPGVLTAVGEAFREPLGRIHWAGAETGDRWAGWMNGAVESGERAAREVLAAL